MPPLLPLLPKSFHHLQHSRFFSQYSRKPHRRPKHKTYHLEPSLDRSISLQSKPNLLLHLRSLLPTPLLLRDLEKHVGFIPKWNYLSLIQKHPSIFTISRGPPISLSLSPKASSLSSLEHTALQQMHPILVTNLRKLLMLTVHCRIPIPTLQLVHQDLGLPDGFEYNFIPKYPQFFSVRHVDGTDYIYLETWDSNLAVTSREKHRNDYSFKIKYAPGFRANRHYLKEVERWQRMEFPSPYLNRVEEGTPEARKRTVGVIHELLSLTMERRLTVDKVEVFHGEMRLPARLVLCLVRHHGIFYLTNKGGRSTVVLKEGYEGCELVEKWPLVKFRERFAGLMGRRSCSDVGDEVAV